MGLLWMNSQLVSQPHHKHKRFHTRSFSWPSIPSLQSFRSISLPAREDTSHAFQSHFGCFILNSIGETNPLLQ